MDHRIPRVGGVISILLALGALLTFLFLNQKFEGPDPVGFVGSPYEPTARFESSNSLPSKQAVLHKGVSVGRVNSVDYDDETDEAVVTFTLDGDLGPIYRDAKLRIGERSLLGDAYLNLLQLGTPAAGEIEPGGEVEGTVASVNFDEALDFLDAEGRKRVRSLIDTVAEGVAPEGNGYRLNGTVGGLSRTIGELRELTAALRGQEQQIGGLVADSATVLDELGSRERAVRSIVASGRATLDAVAANTGSLERALDELPRLLESGRATLSEARPLLSEARPFVTQLGEIAPSLTPAFERGAPFSIGPVSADLIDVIEGLEPQRRALEQIGPRIVRFNRRFLPVVEKAGPTALNTVPIADYVAPRTNSIAAFFANGASAVAHGDEVGRYGRFGVVFAPELLADAPVDGNCDPETGEPAVRGSGFCHNAYPQPNDSLDHRPFSGTYPRLLPYEPPDPATVGDGG